MNPENSPGFFILPEALERPPAVYVLGGLGVAAIGFLDRVSGREVSFSIFYLLPVGLVALHGSARAAVLYSFSSAFVSAALDIPNHAYSHWLIGVWNALVRLGIFLIVSVTVSRLRNHVEIERALATTDSLTGVANSRAFYALLESEVRRMGRTSGPLAVAYVDLDDFKTINDREGHLAGDELLRRVASLLKAKVRATDTVARLGGDEFAILLPDTDLEGARGTLERVREGLRETFGRTPTFSIGAVAAAHAPDSAESLVHAADELMYRVKRGGKNDVRVEPFPP